MLDKVNNLTGKVLSITPLRRSTDLTRADIAPALDYIHGYWKKLQRFHPKDDQSLIGLPNPFLVPSYEEGHEFDYDEMFYWDSYFMIQGMLDETHKELIIGMLENLVFLFERFKINQLYLERL
jgi:alpha,alpha-trehalase